MQQPSSVPRPRDRWVFCLTAIADMIDGLPLLYDVVETGKDLVRIELVMKAGAWEVLQLRPEGDQHVETSVSPHLDNHPAVPFPAWMIDASEALVADLHWAGSRSCSEQGPELLGALVRFRGSMLHGSVF